MVFTATLTGFALSATLLFEATVQAHFAAVKPCWKQTRVPGRATIAAEIAGTIEAGNRFWPGDPAAPYRLMGLVITESGGTLTGNMIRPGEDTHGPCCVSVDETRTTCLLFGIPCPRTAAGIRLKHREDPRWSMLVAGGTLFRYETAAGADRVRGMMLYKYGRRGLDRAAGELRIGQPLTDLPEWKHYIDCYTWLVCIRDRLMVGPGDFCLCLGRD